MAEEKFYSALHWAKKAERFADNAKTSEEKAAQYAEIVESAAFGNIGDIKYTSRTDVPNGGAWCDGALYTKAQFPDIYQMLVDGKLQSTTLTDFDSTVSANGSCGFFGLDTANESFKVPMLKDVYLKAGQAGEMFGAESLPNITGHFGEAGISDTNDYSGAFYKYATAGSNGSFNTTRGAWKPGFNASRSSSTYQDGAKVNPDHVVYRAYVVLYASAAEASVAQAAEFIDGLAGKANVDMDNLSVSGKSLLCGLGKPGGRYVDLQLGASGTNYTAPTNGWVAWGGQFSTTSGNFSLGNSSFYSQGTATGGAQYLGVYIPVKKGEKFYVSYVAVSKTVLFRFIYDEGEK